MPLAPITLDRDAEVPLGTQLTWALRARIAGGELPRGERLPGARELAAHVGVNVNTVRAVFARLEEDGLLRVVHGSGTFVAGGESDASGRGRSGDGAAAEQRDDATQLAAAVSSEARRRGIDPRAIAAALYVQPVANVLPPAAAARGARGVRAAGEERSLDDARDARTEAATRRLLRAEIEQLDRALAELRGAPSLDARPPGPAAAGRLLSAAELAEQRDALAARLAAARADARGAASVPAREPVPDADSTPARSTSTSRRRGGARLRWVPSA